jgi:hypothetical protein
MDAGKLHESVYDMARWVNRKPGKINPPFAIHFKRSPRTDLAACFAMTLNDHVTKP